MAENLKYLLGLWYRPNGAMGDILDRGSLLFASLAMIATTALLQAGMPQEFFAFYTPLLVMAIIYVPGVLLLAGSIGRVAGVSVAFNRDYAPLLTCAAMAWSAVQLPFTLVVLAVRPAPLPVLQAAAGVAGAYFLVLMFFAVRTVLGASNGGAAGIAALSWIPVAGAVAFWGTLMSIFHILASPFFLLYGIYYLRSQFSGISQGLRNRQNFRRMLEAAAVNPHDGEAQYQLGLIHQQRRQYAEAIRRFQNAVSIDHTETDAHFQLGRIALEQQRLDAALAHFQIVLKQNEKHRSSEIHRELGEVYVAMSRFEEADRELSLYTDRREYDPEGLYYYGRALEALGRRTEAREVYQRAVEAARTAPYYRRHLVARWSRLAQKQARKVSGAA